MPTEINKVVFNVSLDHCRLQYDELCGTWRDLERKAQGTVAIAGIFFGGVIGLMRFYPAPSALVLLILISGVSLLVLCSLFSVGALFISEVSCAEDCDNAALPAFEALDQESIDGALRTLRAHIEGRVIEWKSINDDLHKANYKKSSFISAGQYFLFAGIVLVFGGMVFSIFASYPEETQKVIGAFLPGVLEKVK